MYGEGITRINSMIMRILNIENPNDERLKRVFSKNKNFLTEMQIVPVFAFGFPRDKMEDLQRAQLESQLKIGSRREWMERMGKQNVPELLEEIDEDMIEQAMLQVKLQEMLGSGTMNGMGSGATENEGSYNTEDTEDTNQEDTEQMEKE
jgi:hypothetical protein